MNHTCVAIDIFQVLFLQNITTECPITIQRRRKVFYYKPKTLNNRKIIKYAYKQI